MKTLATSSATAMPSRVRIKCSIRSKVGEAPPLVKTGPSIT
jgi:hypothetical protein